LSYFKKLYNSLVDPEKKVSGAWNALYTLLQYVFIYMYSRVTPLSRFGRKKNICKKFPYKLVVRGYFLAIKLRWNATVD